MEFTIDIGTNTINIFFTEKVKYVESNPQLADLIKHNVPADNS